MKLLELLVAAMTIKVDVVQASQCAVTGKLIHTLLLEYPRVIHSQLLTHGVFSKGCSSSRAVPINAAIDNVKGNPAKYLWTGKQAGMQGVTLEDSSVAIHSAELIHVMARENAITAVRMLDAIGIHKQNACRYLEPFQNIRVVLTSTEWENWDWLRIDEAAQPEIHKLAVMMKEARDTADVMVLQPGQWHVPFVTRILDTQGDITYWDTTTDTMLTEAEAINISMSSCAQTSYRKTDYSLEKAEDMYGKLFGGAKIHASPAEHQATPIGVAFDTNEGETQMWPEGVTHMSRNYTYWSGNFCQWIQNRQLIKGHDRALVPDIEKL